MWKSKRKIFISKLFSVLYKFLHLEDNLGLWLRKHNVHRNRERYKNILRGKTIRTDYYPRILMKDNN